MNVDNDIGRACHHDVNRDDNGNGTSAHYDRV